jgi:hypothetical protein
LRLRLARFKCGPVARDRDDAVIVRRDLIVPERTRAGKLFKGADQGNVSALPLATGR